MIGLLNGNGTSTYKNNTISTTKPGTRPSRPSVVPSKRPSEEDAPLAELKHEGPESSTSLIEYSMF
jgi:hypothetical protein